MKHNRIKLVSQKTNAYISDKNGLKQYFSEQVVLTHSFIFYVPIYLKKKAVVNEETLKLNIFSLVFLSPLFIKIRGVIICNGFV